MPKYNTLGQRFVKSVFPNPVPGGTPTVHILDLSYLSHLCQVLESLLQPKFLKLYIFLNLKTKRFLIT